MERVYEVNELNQEIKYLLETGFPFVWVEGELSSLRIPASGHLYFNLKDQESQLRVVFFRNTAAGLKFQLKEGMQVLLGGRVSAYPGRSEYQIIGQKAEPRGVGALQLAFEELKKKLASEGLFATERKRPIPYLIRRLAVISSSTGAAFRDILKVLRHRNPAIEVSLYPALVQGKEATGEIIAGIRELNRLGNFDAILLARGGGSLEDLWAFNEEALARAIVASSIPVISAVGHEVDYTISDFVADLRAPTPSAAAEMISLHREETITRINGYRERMFNRLQFLLNYSRQTLEKLQHRYGFQKAQDLILLFGQQVDDLSERLVKNQQDIMEKAWRSWEYISRNLSGLSPLAVLNRGYSITLALPEKKVVKDAAAVKKGDLVISRLAAGEITSRVTETRQGGRAEEKKPEEAPPVKELETLEEPPLKENPEHQGSLF